MSDRVPVTLRARVLWDKYLPRITVGLLLLLLLLFLIASIVPGLASWVESIRFGGPALLVGVALLIVDLVTNERAGPSVAPVYDDSLALAPRFGEAAMRRDVTIDFAGDSAETFKILLRETTRIMARASDRRDMTLRVRIMVPDLTTPIAVPCNDKLEDDPTYRAANWSRTRSSLNQIISELDDFSVGSGLRQVTLEVRFHRLTPTVKLYVLNGAAALWALYRIEHRPNFEDQSSFIYDTRGTNAPVFTAAADGDAVARRQFSVLTGWFGGTWDSVAYVRSEYARRDWVRGVFSQKSSS